jgi:hypothetical protein
MRQMTDDVKPRHGQEFFCLRGNDRAGSLSASDLSRQPGHFIILDWVGAPSSKAHLGLFGGRGIDKKCSCHYRINHLTSINVDIERPNDGNVLIAGRISVSVSDI